MTPTEPVLASFYTTVGALEIITTFLTNDFLEKPK